jgi:syntaxin 8
MRTYRLTDWCSRCRSSITLKDQETRLRAQYNDLISQFRGFPTSTAPASLSHPNNPSLAPDFAHATSTPSRPPNPSSSFKRSPTTHNSKSVRFSDAPLTDADDAARDALFPPAYHDDPDALPDHSQLDNQQIHEYHSQVLQDQDEQLDRLGESIGRQRELSIQIGDELDSHVQLLDEVDEHMDRHQTRIDGARRRLGTVARKAKDNVQLTIILVLIVILVLLIIILKR